MNNDKHIHTKLNGNILNVCRYSMNNSRPFVAKIFQGIQNKSWKTKSNLVHCCKILFLFDKILHIMP